MTRCGDSGTKAVSTRRLARRADRWSSPDQHRADRIKNSPLHHLWLSQTHLTFGRMNVAIDQVQIHLDVKDTRRILTPLNRAQVRLAKRLLDGRTMDGTPLRITNC